MVSFGVLVFLVSAGFSAVSSALLGFLVFYVDLSLIGCTLDSHTMVLC